MSLKIENLTVIYNKDMEDETLALHGVNAEFFPGEITAIVGEMGSGKSTLADHLNGFLTPTSGRVLLDGQDVCQIKDKRSVLRRIGYVMQRPEKQIFCQSVWEEIAFASKNFGVSPAETANIVSEVVRELGLREDILPQDPLTLSFGQKRIVAIASVLAQKPDYLVLDEPTSGLDDSVTRKILTLLSCLKNSCEHQMGIIFITHNFDYAFALADRFLVLKDGKPIFVGTKDAWSSIKNCEEHQK